MEIRHEDNEAAQLSIDHGCHLFQNQQLCKEMRQADKQAPQIIVIPEEIILSIYRSLSLDIDPLASSNVSSELGPYAPQGSRKLQKWSRRSKSVRPWF